MSRRGQGRELAVLETQISCLNEPLTRERIKKMGIHTGIPIGVLHDDLHNFLIYVLDGSAHLFLRDATLKEYEEGER